MSSSTIWPENSATSAAAPSQESNLRQSNVFILLAQREISPQTKRSPRRFWARTSNRIIDSSVMKSESANDARQELRSWVEAESFLYLSANYCPLLPPPRSTIAAAFSPDGKTLASTHGDHTVKIINCATGKCLKALSGHRRTPWVVRFHPLHPDILASGSLDHEVRLWDAKTAECIGSRDFYRPIASLAFHSQGEILAVASGHKLYIWHYSRRGEASSPTIILKTRRSLRAVHFLPNGAPFLLTAEVNDLDFSDPSMLVATSNGYLRYPPPTIYLADENRSDSGNKPPVMSLPFAIWPSLGRSDGASLSQRTDAETSSDAPQQRGDSSASVRLLTYSTPSGQYELVLSPIRSPAREESFASQPIVASMETDAPAEEGSNQFSPFGDTANWEVPFLQGWLIGQSQASQRGAQLQDESLPLHTSVRIPSSRIHGRSSTRHQGSSRPRTRTAIVSSGNIDINSDLLEQTNSQPIMTRVQSEVATSLAAAAAAELPCTVKLRIWPHDVKNPCAPLDIESDQCRLIIPHVVLCSEMGAHFSPCGRFLAVCVACIMPNGDSDPVGVHARVPDDFDGTSSSPTRHPISAHRVIYELRIYSLEEATFGSVLASRTIRAAHCLTSIQFSPTSDHLLLAYGRRHSSLLKSILIDGDTTVHIYTILEIYRVSDMELVRVLPSADDEVNVACFHPSVGGGFVYGTKEGKLRILQCNISEGFKHEETSASDDVLYEEADYTEPKLIQDTLRVTFAYSNLLSLTNNKLSYTIDTLTGLRNKRCVGSSHGWLGFVSIDNSSNPFLLDPFTKTLINLSFSSPSCPRAGTINKLILSTDPHSRNCKDYVVVVTYSYLLNTKLAFYVQGDDQWIDPKGKLKSYYDITCRDDTLFALGPGPEIETWDLNSCALMRTIRLQDCCPAEDRKRFDSDLYCSQWYLALSPSSGHMFVVMRYKGEFVRYDGEVVREGDTLTDYCSELLVCPYRTVWFHVYKVVNHCCSGKGVLMEATESHLSGFALFVEGNESVMVSNGESKGNKIYFTDDYWEQVDVDYSYGRGHDMGIFDLRNGKFEDAMEDQQQRIVPPPFWIDY